MVKAIVIWAVGLCMIGGSQDSHLVPVYGVAAEEVLHFFSYLLGRGLPTPGGQQLTEHTVWTTVVLLAEATEFA